MLRNSIKVWVVAIVFTILLAYFGHWLWGRQGTLLGIVVALAVSFVIFSAANQLAASFFKGRRLEGKDPWNLQEKLEIIGLKAKTEPPKIFLIPTSYPTAFVSGMKADSYSLYLTEGLLKRLSSEETEVVLAHLVARIRNKDVLPAMVGAVLAASLLSFTDQMPSRTPNFISRLAFFIFVPFAWVAIHIHSKPSHIFSADLLASQWISSPMALAKALWKLECYAQTLAPSLPYALGHFFVVNPLTGRRFSRYFSVHPPVSQRIKRLVGAFPI